VGRGLFFAFEGTEGSGKSTQVRLLAGRFEAAGLPVRTTREPGGTALGESVREILLSGDYGEIDPRTEALLHSAARAEHVAHVIRPALETGSHVITDRFSDSTLAYQGGGSGLPLDDLRSVQRFATGHLEPDLRILLLTSVEAGLRRRFSERSSLNRVDRAELGYHERVLATFSALAKRNPDCWVVIDGEQPPDNVNDDVVTAINDRYPDLGLR
jgi:dTMP kinase